MYKEVKLEIIIGAAHSVCNLKYSVPNTISIAFHNGSNYDYHFIIKVLAEGFEKKLTHVGENTKNYITFMIPIENEVTRTDKNGEKITEIYLKDYNLMIAQDL